MSGQYRQQVSSSEKVYYTTSNSELPRTGGGRTVTYYEETTAPTKTVTRYSSQANQVIGVVIGGKHIILTLLQSETFTEER